MPQTHESPGGAKFEMVEERDDDAPWLVIELDGATTVLEC
jgi:hypothetical protein